ncbi:MAG TPA: glycoside hydrolase family 3 C-terminal domain-containing protein [bacterium]|nr:glycoside hydrolase family 3 C-terminal domain-containing protein [bacterium]HPN42538.1 glycoside hydrolase family 3 C-terminal domain-containing protein [bacterium]
MLKKCTGRIIILVAGILVFLGMQSCAQKPDYSKLPAYKNPTLSVEERVDDLVSRMTLEQKVSQMVNAAPAIDTLDIPEYNWWNECLHGVARSGKATVFPQAIGMAATWDSENMLKVATAISDEARAKHHEYLRKGKRGIYQGLTFWSPNINIFRDPRWGRGMETYGEDPYLTGNMAVQFINGLQGNHPKYLKVVATAKHFVVHSGPEPERHTFDARISERDFQETYLPHFRTSIMQSHAYSVMCAYNRYMGEACCGSNFLLTQILRDQWGFQGYVVSDCGAIFDIWQNHKVVNSSPEAAALAVKSGCDLNCGNQYPYLVEAVAKGYITEAEIDVAVKRLFTARIKLGMFDPEELVPYSKIPYDVVDCPAHRTLALETARKSIVLLKNDNNILPLKKNLKSIAVIGPNADDVEVLLANYNGVPVAPVSPLQGIKDKVSAETQVHYALGCEWAEGLPVFTTIPESALFTEENGEKKPGLKAEYFNNREFQGDPLVTRIDPKVDFYWWETAPVEGLDDDNFSVRWSGEFVAPVTGTYAVGGEGFNGFRIFINDAPFCNFFDIHHPSKTYENIDLVAGQSYKIKVEYFEVSGDASMRLLWAVPGYDFEKEAIEAAKQAEVIVLFMGLSPRLEGEEMKVKVAGFEGGDRLTLDIPPIQEKLMQTLNRLGKPMVLVLLNGSAVSVNWANDNIPAIVEAWYPGQAAGTAIADVLFGDYNPGGRLPVTFYKSVNQLPAFTDYNMTSQTYRYFTGDALYAFGHGMSYTTFEYSNLTVPASIEAGQPVTVTATVKNTGKMAGEEVVQLYVSDLQASVPVPVRSLQGFDRIALKPGESKPVTFTLTPAQLSIIDAENKRVEEPGKFKISIGGKQPDLPGAATTQVVSAELEVTGSPAYLE